MLKNAIEYLVGLKENKVYDINGRTYSDNRLALIDEPRYAPEMRNVTSLDALENLIKTEIDGRPTLPLFVRVVSPTEVIVFSALNERQEREKLYCAKCADANFDTGWRSHEEMMIQLQSSFLPTEDRAYLLDLLSRLVIGEAENVSDNGVCQTVTVKTGVSLKSAQAVKGIVNLKPFRIFREVEQPASQFLLRIKPDGRVALFEADGGCWKMAAKDSIAWELEYKLDELIKAGKVVVLRG